jgi:hypothetical protein
LLKVERGPPNQTEIERSRAVCTRDDISELFCGALATLMTMLARSSLRLHAGLLLTGGALVASAASGSGAVPGDDGRSRCDSIWCSVGASGQTLDVGLGTARDIVGTAQTTAGAPSARIYEFEVLGVGW